MNRQMMTLWGHTLMSVLQSQNQNQNQMDKLAEWFQKTVQDFSQINSNLFQLWGFQPRSPLYQNMKPGWLDQFGDIFEKMQQLSIEWMGMVPEKDYITQADKVTRLEEKVAEHTKTIEKMQNFINASGQGNNELIHQFQGLIDQQSRQFQQLTTSFSEYVKSGAEKTGEMK